MSSRCIASEYQLPETKIAIERNGHFVSRRSDWIIYSVEAANIDKIVSMYAPSTKVGAIVGGQTSCKAPEIAAFEKYLPEDAQIVSCHSLHAPKVDPKGQPLVIINHRSNKESVEFVAEVLSCLESKTVYLSAEEHDRITADTQAVTHAAFLSMGSAWMANNQYPWTIDRWSGGVENAKVNISLRIYANKWHVYAGLAITNPAAHKQILQYASSVTALFKLMLERDEDGLRKRLYAARDSVFGRLDPSHSLLLSDEILGRFSLSKTPPGGLTPNSHLSVLAIVDSWHNLNIVPYDHMICSTPVSFVFCWTRLLRAFTNY
jgi:prephenate dehydrogenase (NADP+)